jgi:hypothetical protein
MNESSYDPEIWHVDTSTSYLQINGVEKMTKNKVAVTKLIVNGGL